MRRREIGTRNDYRHRSWGVLAVAALALGCSTQGASRSDGRASDGAGGGGSTGSGSSGAAGGAGHDGGDGGAGGGNGNGGGAGVDSPVAGSGGTTPVVVTRCNALPTSCTGLSPTCGPNGDADCCESDLVTGGTYLRDNFDGLDATVRTFCLDKYETTVARFRRFVAAYPGSRPAAGAGKNPNNPNDPGWDPSWDAKLPATQANLDRNLANLSCSPFRFWTLSSTGQYESSPMNCVDWFTFYAFCAWDGGWLPTRVEWDYAARGGAQQRTFPWSVPPSDSTLDSDHATYECSGDAGDANCSSILGVLPVGSKPSGDGLFGQSDLIGNVTEWLQDWHLSTDAQIPCVECADLGTAGKWRELRGGHAASSPQNLAIQADATSYVPEEMWAYLGGRCARAP